MIAVIDTNFLARYFAGSGEIGADSKNIFEDPSTFLIIPAIVLVELKYMVAKEKLSTKALSSLNALLNAGNCMVYPLDLGLLDYIPTNLDIHDGIIFATASIQLTNFKETIYILTKDQKIKLLENASINIVW